MSELILHLVNSSICAGWLILIVLLLRLILLGKIRGKYGIILWLPIVIRLVIPYFPESSISLLPSAETIRSEELYYSFPIVDSGFSKVDSTVNPTLAKMFSTPSSESGSYIEWLTIFTVIWLIGFSLMFIYSLVCQIRLSLITRERIPVGAGIYTCDSANDAFVMGIIKPIIIIPAQLDKESVQYVILHEKTHIANHDYLWKILAYVLLCVYWFNPLLWIAYYIFCSDLEFICDSKAIKDMEIKDRKAYARALLQCSSLRKLIVIYPLNFGKQSIKSRIKYILKKQKTYLSFHIISILTFIFLVVFFLSNPYHYLKMNSDDVDYHVALPYKEDFEDKRFQYVRNTDPAYKWMIKESGGNHYLECVEYKENEVLVGNNISPILLGDKSWAEYSLSFDVRLGGDSWVLFAPYSDSNITAVVTDEEEYKDPWALFLDSSGRLFYQTFLGESYLIFELTEINNCFYINEWNHITLYRDGENLQMIVNGVNVGKVADYSVNNYGRVSFGGTVGVKLDNIEIVAETPNTLLR